MQRNLERRQRIEAIAGDIGARGKAAFALVVGTVLGIRSVITRYTPAKARLGTRVAENDDGGFARMHGDRDEPSRLFMDEEARWSKTH